MLSFPPCIHQVYVGYTVSEPAASVLDNQHKPDVCMVEKKPDRVLKVDENEIKASNGSRYWNALYMQDPTVRS